MQEKLPLIANVYNCHRQLALSPRWRTNSRKWRRRQWVTCCRGDYHSDGKVTGDAAASVFEEGAYVLYGCGN